MTEESSFGPVSGAEEETHSFSEASSFAGATPATSQPEEVKSSFHVDETNEEIKPLLTTFQQRAELRAHMDYDMRATGQYLAASLKGERPATGVAREIQIEGMINKQLPLSDAGRALELKWKAKQPYDPKMSALSMSETSTLRLGRGVIGVLAATEYMGDLLRKLKVQRFDMLGFPILTGGKVPGEQLQTAHKESEGFFTHLSEAYPPDPDAIEEPSLNIKDQRSIPWKLAGVATESIPSLVAAAFVGEFAPALFRAGALGRVAKAAAWTEKGMKQYGTATAFAAIGMKARHDEIERAALEKGLAPDVADHLGDSAAIMLAPMDVWLNAKWFPIAKHLGGKTPSETMYGQLVDSALTNALQGAGSRGGTEVFRYASQLEDAVKYDPKQGINVWPQMRAALMGMAETGLESAVIGLPIGLAIHASEGLKKKPTSAEIITKLSKDLLGRDLDVTGPREFYRKLRREFNVSRVEARNQTEFMSLMMNEMGRQNLLTEPEAWGTFYARISERDPAVGSTLFSHLNRVIGPEGYFSKVRETALDYLPAKGNLPADQILQTLKNKGSKAEELRWSNLEAMLTDGAKAGATLSRQEVLNFLDRNEVKITTVFKKAESPEYNHDVHQDALRAYEKAEKDLHDTQVRGADINEKHGAKSPEYEAWRKEFKAVDDSFELARHKYMDATRGVQDQTKFSFVRPSGPSAKYEEWVMRWPSKEKNSPGEGPGEFGEEQTKFSSAHWEEKNPIVHIRVDERVDPVTKKTYLNVIEVQSDWHQEGAKHGYITDALQEEETTLRRKVQSLVDIHNDDIRARSDEQRRLEAEFGRQDDRVKTGLEKLYKREAASRDALKAASDELDKLQMRSAPEAPFSKTWTDLALKKILIEAVNRGYDRVAWQPGYMQDRFQGAAEEGRSIFYDKVLHNKFLDLVRKFDPSAKVEHVKMQADDSTTIGIARLNDETVTHDADVSIPSIEITKQIADGVLGGLPLFQRGTRSVSAYLKSLLTSESERTNVRAIRLKDGTYIAADVDTHYQIAKQMMLKPDQVDRTGFLRLEKGKLEFSNDHDTRGLETAFELNALQEIAYNPKESVEPESGTVVDDKKVDFLGNVRVGRNDYLFQDEGLSPRASWTMLTSGRAFIRGIQNADFGSVVHELAHFARRVFLNGEDLKTVERLMKVDAEKGWTTANEEEFVKWFELALRKGRSPKPEMQHVFASIGEYLKKTYPRLTAGESKIAMNRELEGAIQRLFQWDSEPVKMQREKIVDLDKEVTSLAKENEKLKNTKVDPERSQEQEAQIITKIGEIETNLEAKKKELRQSIKDLDRLQDQEFDDGARETLVKRGIQLNSFLEMEQRLNPEEYATAKAGMFRAMRGRTESISEMGVQTVYMRVFKKLADDVDNIKKMYIARLQPVQHEALRGTSGAARRWMRGVQEEKPGTLQYTNYQRVREEIDPGVGANIAPPEAIQAADLGFKTFYEESTKQAIAQDMYRRMGSGDVIKLKESYDYTIPRYVTEDGMRLLATNSPERQALVKELLRLNPEMNETALVTQLDEFVKQHIGKIERDQPLQRVRGALEFSRTIESFPPVWIGLDGKRVDIFHTDIKQIFHSMIVGDGARLAVTKVFGQGLLTNLHHDVRAISKVLSVFDVRSQYTKEELGKSLVDSRLITAEEAKASTKKQLEEIAREMDVPTAPGPDELLNSLASLTEADIPSGREPIADKELRALATEFGGVSSKAPLGEVLAGLKKRLSQNIQDHVFETLADGHERAGGDKTHMMLAFRSLQEYPVYNISAHQGWNLFRLYSAFNGLRQTSLAAVKNAFQTPRNLVDLVGPTRFTRALAEVTEDYHKSYQKGLELGAYQEHVRTWMSDSSSTLTRWSSFIRQAGGLITGQDRMTEFNNNVSAAAGRNFADDIKAKYKGGGKLGELDANSLRRMRINEFELAEIAQGKMTSNTYAKIVQNTVSVTQHVTESGHRKAGWELDPRFKLLFAYQSFAYGEARRVAGILSEVKSAYKSGDGKRMLASLYPVFVSTAMAVGTSAMMKMAIDGIRGAPARPDDDDWWDYTGGALIESTLFSQIGFLSNPFIYSDSGAQAILNVFPHVNALGNLLDFGMSFVKPTGRYGKYPWIERFGKTLLSDTPAVKAALHQWELSTYPELRHYEETRVHAFSWMEKQKGGQSSTPSRNPISPEFEPVWRSAARFDLEGLKESSREYYQDQMRHRVDPDLARTRLKASLNTHRPLPMRADQRLLFLRSVPKEKRKEYWTSDLRYEAMMDMVTGGAE